MKDASTVVAVSGLSTLFSVHPIFHKGPEALNEVESDLLLITEMDHMKMGPGPLEFDTILGGAISRAVADQDNKGGKLGHFVIVPSPDGAKIKNVLLVGIGSPGAFKRLPLCGLYNLFFEQAVAIGARRATIAIFPGRLTEFSISGLAAVLRCRLVQFASQHSLGELKEIEILCAPQAKRWVIDGLTVEKSLCSTCSEPRIS